MPPEPASYQRLRGAGHREILPWWGIVMLFFVIGFFALLLRGRRVRLWLGPDHLLMVESDGFREYYKRFRYEDIQVLTVRKTVEGKIVAGVMGGLGVVFLAMGAAVWTGDTAGGVILSILGLIFGGVALGNVLLGPTCECQLRTAVQTEKLVALGRLRAAVNAVELLRPRIVAAQGELTVEELYAKSQAALFAAAQDSDSPPVIAGRPILPPAPVVKPPPQPYRSAVHFILFGLLVADLPITALHFVFPDAMALNFLSGGLFLLIIGFLITALIKQHNTDLSQILKRLTWSALIVQGVSLITAVGYLLYKVIENPGAFDTTLQNDPVFVVMSVLFTGASVGLGIMGFIHLRKYRARVNIPESPMNIPPPTI